MTFIVKPEKQQEYGYCYACSTQCQNKCGDQCANNRR